jgi:hypothetical protein
MFILIKKFIAAAKSKVMPTLERQLMLAIKTDNVGQFARLLEMNAGAGIGTLVTQILRDEIKRGNVQAYIRVFTAVASSPSEILVRPILVCKAIHQLEKTPIDLEKRMALLLELGDVARQCRNPRYAAVFEATCRGNFGGRIPPTTRTVNRTFVLAA